MLYTEPSSAQPAKRLKRRALCRKEMKTTIAGILLRNAVEYVQRTRTAHARSRPNEEIRFSISAQLMIALAIEGIGNEIGEVAFDKWT